MMKTNGFSLVELLVVVTIILSMVFLGLPSISSYFQISINSATRDIASITKEAFNASLVSGKVMRIVYDIKNCEYWVESAPQDSLLDSQTSINRNKRLERFTGKIKKDIFNIETSITKKKQSLPRGVEFEDVTTEAMPTPQKEGLALTHFFPYGYTEQTLVHLKDQSQHHASLMITPGTGKTIVYDYYVPPKEAFSN